MLGFTGERIVPGAIDCEPTFAQKMYQEHVARYAFASQFAAGADALDVGCGVGYGSQWLAKAGAKSVLGFDLAEPAIEHARMHYFHPAVSFSVQDAAAMDYSEAYDLVTCFELIEHIAPQERVLDHIKRALRKDGVLVISTPRPLNEIRTHFHFHEMKFEELHRMLAQRFQHVESFFEVNCFGSFIGQQLPERIDRIVPVSPAIGMEQADYFVFVASDAPIADRPTIQPVLSLNDDSYVLTLEKDVGVLRGVENIHTSQIAQLQTERDSLSASYSDAVEKSGSISSIQQETSATRLAIEQLNREMSVQAAKLAEAGSLRARIASLEAQLAAAPTAGRLETLENDLRHERQAGSDDKAILGARIASLETSLAHAPKPEQLEALQSELRQASNAADQECSGLRATLAEATQRLADFQSQAIRPEQLEALQGEIRQVRTAADQERDGLRSSLAETGQRLAQIQTQAFQDLTAKMIELEALQRAHAAAELNQHELARELDAVRRVLAEQSERTAMAQTEAFALRASAERLPEALARASNLENEINALRYRFDQSEATLARFRNSFSWAVTSPLRAIWRNYRKLTGRSLP